MGDSYWVYWDHVIPEDTIIHVGSCRFCNNGKGIHDAPHTTSEWMGRYNSAAEALQAAQQRDGGKRAHLARPCKIFGAAPASSVVD